MAREGYIEKRACELMLLAGALATPKHGKDGWPDRQILLGFNRHIWMEFKQLKGKLRAVQVERIKQLRAAGEMVYEPRSIEAALTYFAQAKVALGAV